MRVAAAPFQADKSPSWLIADLRSDHAGELGAVMIYTGILGYRVTAQSVNLRGNTYTPSNSTLN